VYRNNYVFRWKIERGKILDVIVSIIRIRAVLIASYMQFCLFGVVPKYSNVKGHVSEFYFVMLPSILWMGKGHTRSFISTSFKTNLLN
jgi:hypothetical protein